MVDARKAPIDGKAAVALARSMQKVLAARGSKVLCFDMAKARPSDSDLAAAIVGPSGNLRAPALKIGRILAVGFDEAMYDGLLA